MTTSQTMAQPWQVTVSGTNQVGLGGCWDWLDTASVWLPLSGGIKALGKSVPTHWIPTGDPLTPPLFSNVTVNWGGVAQFGHVGV